MGGCQRIQTLRDVDKSDFTWVSNLGYGDCLFAAISNYIYMETHLTDKGRYNEAESLTIAGAEAPGSRLWNDEALKIHDELCKLSDDLRERTAKGLLDMKDDIYDTDIGLSLEFMVTNDYLEDTFTARQKPLYRCLSGIYDRSNEEANEYGSMLSEKYPKDTIKLTKKSKIGDKLKRDVDIVDLKRGVVKKVQRTITLTEEDIERGRVLIGAKPTDEEEVIYNRLKEANRREFDKVDAIFLEAHPTLYDKYVAIMGNTCMKEWGGQQEIWVLSRILKRNIQVYTQNANNKKKYTPLAISAIYPRQTDNLPIYLYLHTNGKTGKGSHYEVIFPTSIGQPTGVKYQRKVTHGGKYNVANVVESKILFNDAERADEDAGRIVADRADDSDRKINSKCRKLTEEEDLGLEFHILYSIAQDCGLTHDDLLSIVTEKARTDDEDAAKKLLIYKINGIMKKRVKIQKFRKKCKFNCGFEGTKSKVIKHEDECSLNPDNEDKMECEFDCGFEGTYREVEQHELTCSLGFLCEFEDRGCPFKGTYENVEEHEEHCKFKQI